MAIDGTTDHDEFLQVMKGWKAVWLKAIALSWKDSNFKQELLKNAKHAIHRQFDFKLPEHIDLTVFDPTAPKSPPTPRKVPDAGYHPDSNGAPWIMPDNQINLALPPAPKDPEDFAIALVSFSDSNNYPFSTC